MMRTAPPQAAQVWMSISNTRFKRCALLIEARAHRGPALGRRCVLRPGRRLSCCAPAPPDLGHPRPLDAVRGEHALVAGEIDSRPGHQRGQPREEIQRLEDARSVVQKR